MSEADGSGGGGGHTPKRIKRRASGGSGATPTVTRARITYAAFLLPRYFLLFFSLHNLLLFLLPSYVNAHTRGVFTHLAPFRQRSTPVTPRVAAADSDVEELPRGTPASAGSARSLRSSRRGIKAEELVVAPTPEE